MDAKSEHTAADSEDSEDEFPPFVEAIRIPQQGAVGRFSEAEIQRNDVGPDALERVDAVAFGPDRVPALDRFGSSTILQKLGPWRIVREIGRGGMGIVYEAIRFESEQRVALKFLPSSSGIDFRRLDRFRHEAHVIERLTHPNIVRLVSVEHEGHHHFLVMQLIEGTSLDRVVGTINTLNGPSADTELVSTGPAAGCVSRPCNTDQSEDDWVVAKLLGPGTDRYRYSAALVQQAAQALSYAHSQKIIHRDIKPSNLLIDRSDTLWITDFGLAQIQGEQGLTATGDLLGTLRYMSPEQAMASRIPVDHRTDVYSLGATFYELLCGQPAFAEDNRKELLRQVLFDQPTALKKRDSAIPVPLQIIVEKAMQKDPRQRYSTAGEMADDLFRFLNDRPIHAKRLPFWEPVLRWCRRNRMLAVSLTAIVTLLAVLVVGRLIFLELKGQHEETVSLLERTANAEQESKAFAQLREVSRYRQTGLSGLRDRIPLLDLQSSHLSQSVRFELRNEWLSCMARADWSFTSSIPCDSPVAALSPSGQLLAEFADPEHSERIRIRAVTGNSEVLCDGAHLNVKAMWFSQGSNFLIATDLESYWQIFRVSDGRKMFEIPQLAAGCDVCDETSQVVFWHATPVVMLGLLSGQESTPTLQAHTIEVPALLVRFSPNGRRLAILDELVSPKLSVMNTDDGRVIQRQSAAEAITVAWSPDSKLIAVPNQAGRILIRDAETTRVASALAGNESQISGISWHPSGNYLITTSWTGETLLRHVWTGRVLVRSHESLDAAGFSDDGHRVGWRLKEGALRLAEWTEGEVVNLPWDSRNSTDVPAGVCLHPNGRIAAVFSLAGFQLFDLHSGSVLQRVPLAWTLAAEFSETGNELVVLTRSSIQRWPLVRSRIEPSEGWTMGPPHVASIPFVQNGVLLKDGERAIVRHEQSQDLMTELRTSDGKFVRTVGESAYGLDVARSGSFIARRGWRADVAEIFDPVSSVKLAELYVGNGSVPSASLDGKYFVSSTLEQIQFWDTTSWKPAETLKLDAPVVAANAAFHPRDRLMMLRMMPSRLGIVDPETRTVIARIDELEDYFSTSSSFSSNGDYFVECSSDPSGVRVWNLARMKQRLAANGLNWSSEVPDRSSTDEPAATADLEKPLPPLEITMENHLVHTEAAIGELLAVVRLLTSGGRDPRMQNQVAWRLLIAPPELRDNVEALRLARLSNVQDPDNTAVRNTLALACYRNTLYAEAEQLLLRNLNASPRQELTMDLIILAMIASANGQPTTCQTYRVWAEQNYSDHPPVDNLTLRDTQHLFKELQQLAEDAK